jgi:hypothetical protein
MFSKLPTVLLYSSIPFIFCPSNLNTLGVSGYSLSSFHNYSLTYTHPKGIGLCVKQDVFDAFSALEGSINSTVHLNENLAITPGFSIDFQRHQALSNSSLDLNFATTFTQPKTQSLLYLDYNLQHSQLQFSATHLYRLDPHLLLGATWNSYQNTLDLRAHYQFKNNLFSLRQNRHYLALSYALHKKKFWLQITLNTGNHIAPPLFLAQW